MVEDKTLLVKDHLVGESLDLVYSCSIALGYTLPWDTAIPTGLKNQL